MDKRKKDENLGLATIIWFLNVMIVIGLIFYGAFVLQFGFNLVLASYLGLAMMPYAIALGIGFFLGFMGLGKSRNMSKVLKHLEEGKAKSQTELTRSLNFLKDILKLTVYYGFYLLIFLILGFFIK